MPITEGGNFTPDNNIVSPGVFTRENDLTGISQGIQNIGAVIVAPFPKGPGFSPTLLTNITDLQNQFGIPDGVYYGPYTATQYLQEKGFVTVCRVGALTGYHQLYPFFIWAEQGTWTRATDAGWVSPGASTVSLSGLSFVSASSNAINGTSAGYTGSVTFTTQSVSLILQGGQGTANPNFQNNSGSNLYFGQTVNGTIAGTFSFTGSLNVLTSSATPQNLFSAILAQNLFTGSIFNVGPILTSTQYPFNGALLEQVYISQSYDACNNLSIDIGGLLTGSIGAYNGGFNGGTGTFNPCNGTWSTGSYFYKVLAVLADTQNATINNQLQSPGFFGSTMIYDSTISGSTNILLNFDLSLSQSNDGGYGIYQFSLNPNDPKYITNVFGFDPTVGNPAKAVAGSKIEAGYLYSYFADDITIISNNPSNWRVHGNPMPSGSWTGEPLNFTDQYSLNISNGDSQYSLTNAFTPWVISQQISPWNGGTPSRYPLFQLFTLADGTDTNTSYKIEISNVKLAGTVAGTDWGTFSLAVRDFSDTDKKPSILEQFNNLTLDPTDPNFIARRIGDQFNFIRFDGKIITFGIYQNNSSYIRVSMSPNNYPVMAVPAGFDAYSVPVNGALGFWCDPIAYSKASVYGLFPGKYPSGVVFDNSVLTGADSELTNLYPTASTTADTSADNLQYFAPVPAGATIGQNTIFALDVNITTNGVSSGSYASLTGSNAIPFIFDAVNESTYVKMRNFVFGFQGGFDGQSPAIDINTGADITAGNTQGLNCATSTTAGSVAYNQCIGALGNSDEFDINLIATPGIIYQLHPYVTNLVVEMCQNRGDCFYIMDIYDDSGNPTSGQIENVVSLGAQFDTNYAATYYPWIWILDTNINQIVLVPPSVVLPGIYAANDKAAGEWWAPAGLNRGGIPQATQLTDRTTHAERDILYEGKINPIAAFPGTGIVVWGQKTLQNENSALNRINVRRLLIEIKKFFASTAKYIIFEQNTAATRNKFLAIVNPYLESVQQRSGLYAFQVVMDDSNNTPDLIDQNILYGQIYLKPTRTAEFIVLDFNILPTGASFPTA